MKNKNQRAASAEPLVEAADPEAPESPAAPTDGNVAPADVGSQEDGSAREAQTTDDPLSAESLQAELADQRRQATEYLEHLQRLQAEFANYRRRMSQEQRQAADRGKEEVLRALLPILGNLHLALQHAEGDAMAVRQGVQMIWQQFESFLRDAGVEPIETVGHSFDPAYHEALSTAPATAECPASTIVAEINAGYTINGRLLRPAQVVVARAEEPAEAAVPAEEKPPVPEAE